MINRLVHSLKLVSVAALLASGCAVHDSGRVAQEWASESYAEGSSGDRFPHIAGGTSGRSAQLAGMQPEEAPDVWVRALLSFQFQDQLQHARVRPFIEHYRRHGNIIRVSSARAEPFAYFILTEIERRGLPGELLLLPIVESGYAAEATSSGRAAGIWQFIPSTGAHFGLIQDDWYDGRRDVYQSTHAALDYLESLHGRFGDWYLALAAYNFGQGNVARAIAANAAAGRKTDYWNLQLSAEAMDYVPRMLALRALFADPEHYGIELPTIANQPYIEPVHPGRQADLLYLAELSGWDSQEILRLNPGYRRSVTHPQAAQHVLMPTPAARRLQRVLQQHGEDKPLVRQSSFRVVSYRVRPGDTLSQIARSHEVSVATLRQTNHLSGDLLQVGQQLSIPNDAVVTVAAAPPAGRALPVASPTPAVPLAAPVAVAAIPVASSNGAVHASPNPSTAVGAAARANTLAPPTAALTTRAGSSTMATDPVTRVASVRSVPVPTGTSNGTNAGNGISTSNGQTNNTATAGTATAAYPDSAYVVTAGDSLWSISQRHGVEVDHLRQTNGLTADTLLRPGQVLKVPRSIQDRGRERLDYSIQPGDSLAAIARRFQVDITDLQRWNGLQSHSIRAGDTLTVYREHESVRGL